MAEYVDSDGNPAELNRTMEIIWGLLDEFDDAAFGPGHLVLSDGNLEDGHIEYCLKDCDKWEAGEIPSGWCDMNDHWQAKWMNEMLAATRKALNELKAIPSDEREFLYR